MIPFSDYAPDRSDFDLQASDIIKNVIPTASGYGPFSSPVALSTALAAVPKGAFTVRDDTGSVHIYAGTATKLYEFNIATLGWTDRSGAKTFAVPTDSYWSFTLYGDHVIANNIVDGPYVLDMSAGGNFAALGGSPPISRIASVVGDFVFLGENAAQSRRVTWSGLGDDAHWTAREKSSDYQTFPDGEDITGIIGFEKGGLIFQRYAIREIIPALDTPFIWQFQKTEDRRGGYAPWAIVSSGRDIFYLAQDGFYQYPSSPIGTGRVNKTFIADVDPTAIKLVQGAIDPLNQAVYWRYKSRSNASTTITDKIITYHYAEGINKWATIEQDLSWIFSSSSPGYTLDSLDTLGYTIDALPFSLDSPILTAGAPVIAGFTSDFKLCFFQGNSMEATLQTADSVLTEGRRTIVNGFRPISDAGSVYGRISQRDRHGATRTWGTEAAINSSTGLIPTRSSGRLHRFEVRIPSAEVWSHIHGVEPDGKPEGLR